MKSLFNLFKFIFSLYLLLIVTNSVIAAVSDSHESEAKKSVTQGLPALFASKNQQVLISLVTKNAQLINTAIDQGALSSCSQGEDSSCQLIFKQVIKAIKKILTPEYRMTNAIHLFNANSVKYSLATAQKISSILLSKK